MAVAAIPYVVAAIGAVSAIQQGQVASANAKSQANIAEYNSKVAENNAVSARQQASANEEAQRRQAGVALGRARASAVESGTGLDGSTGLLYGQSVANADLDAKNIIYAGELKGQGLDSEAYMQKSSVARFNSNAASAESGSYLSAAGSAFGAYGNYLRKPGLQS